MQERDECEALDRSFTRIGVSSILDLSPTRLKPLGLSRKEPDGRLLVVSRQSNSKLVVGRIGHPASSRYDYKRTVTFNNRLQEAYVLGSRAPVGSTP